MDFKEVRERFLYLHSKRDLSKRKNKIKVIENNFPKRSSRDKTKKNENNKSHDIYSIEPKRRVDHSYSSNDDQYETYVPEKDKRNRGKYVPPKKSTTNYQGRRCVKFKETTEYSEEHFGSLRREKRPAPRKIMCVTEIMVDISDTESEEYDDTTSQERAIKTTEVGSAQVNTETETATMFPPPDLPPSYSSGARNMVPPEKLDFLNSIRKRSQKRREKENENNGEKQLSEDTVKNLYYGNSIKIPYITDAIHSKGQK